METVGLSTRKLNPDSLNPDPRSGFNIISRKEQAKGEKLAIPQQGEVRRILDIGHSEETKMTFYRAIKLFYRAINRHFIRQKSNHRIFIF